MKKHNTINPIGPKGNEINERMKELMGITPINENKSTSVIELTKIGPDGKAYAIVRENHEYYIKSANKTTNLIAEDFTYIGGLMNKKSEAYPSYAKAIKHLNLKFNSLSEVFNKTEKINVFLNDNLINEMGVAGFSSNNGSGFSNEGNLEGNTSLYNEEDKSKDNPWAICTASVGREDKEKYESCVMSVKKEKGIDENLQECDMYEEDDELTETEKLIDEMLVDDIDESTLAPEIKAAAAAARKKKAEEKPVNENKLSIARALEKMDFIIDSLSEGKVKKKVYSIK
jgi:hypothetical protein